MIEKYKTNVIEYKKPYLTTHLLYSIVFHYLYYCI